MILFEQICNSVLENKQKKELSGYDYYKMIRKPTPPTGSAFKDKSKYSRKEKHKKTFNEGVKKRKKKRKYLKAYFGYGYPGWYGTGDTAGDSGGSE